MGAWAKKIGLILLGVLLLALVEGGLRLFWTPPAQDLPWNAIRPFVVRDGVAMTDQRFRGALRLQKVPVPKAAGVTRIVCLGGSTTFGYPYVADDAWPAQLAHWLAEVYPDQRFEVVNLGGNSYGSERVLGLVNGLAVLEPDYVLVALGDTEFVEDSYRFARQTSSRGQLLSLVRRLYLTKLMATVLPRKKPQEAKIADGAAGALFAPVLDGTVYRPDEERRRQVLRRFAENLSLIVKSVRSLGARPVLLTLPANLGDWPPDPDERRPPVSVGERWQRLVSKGERLLGAGDRDGALTAWLQAAGLWDGNAGFCYRLGRLLLDAGRADEALVFLERARDLDPAPVRVSSKLLRVVRQTAAGNNLPLVDLEKGFAAESADGVIGSTFLLDHAHPNRKGHRLIASLVIRILRSVFPEAWRFDRKAYERLVTERFSVSEVPPQLDPNLAFVWGQIYLRKGLEKKALQAFRQAYEGGYRPYATVPLAQLLARGGRFEEAWQLADAAAREYPDFRETWPVLAWLDWMTGRLERAEVDYRRSMEYGWRDERTYGGLVEVLMGLEKNEEALQVLQEGLKQHSESCLLLELAVRMADKSGSSDWYGGALEEYRLQEDGLCEDR